LKLYERERRTSGGITVSDITDEVNAAVRGSGIRSGIACVYTPHTTCCVRVNEFETGLLDDFAALLGQLVPSETSDAGFARDQPQCVSMLLGPAGESIPVAGGELLLGRWQRVLFVELDSVHDGRWLVEVVGSQW
jgi:secondary thiamine-phosphate synthase enzyme